MSDIISLRQMQIGQSGRIATVEALGEMGRRIRDMGLIPGTTVSIVGRAPLKAPCATAKPTTSPSTSPTSPTLLPTVRFLLSGPCQNMARMALCILLPVQTEAQA